MLHLKGLDGAVFGNDFFEDFPESRNVPLPIAQFVKPSALRILRFRGESPVK